MREGNERDAPLVVDKLTLVFENIGLPAQKTKMPAASELRGGRRHYCPGPSGRHTVLWVRVLRRSSPSRITCGKTAPDALPSLQATGRWRRKPVGGAFCFLRGVAVAVSYIVFSAQWPFRVFLNCMILIRRRKVRTHSADLYPVTEQMNNCGRRAVRATECVFMHPFPL